MIEITYHKEGDYFIPDLYLKKEEYEKDYQIGKYGHSFPCKTEYLATSASVSVQSKIPIVGLSSFAFFNSSYILTYISIWPMSWCVTWLVFKSINTKHFKM